MNALISFFRDYYGELKEYSPFEKYFHILFCMFFGWELSFTYIVTFFRQILHSSVTFQLYFYPVIIGIGVLCFCVDIIKKLRFVDVLFFVVYASLILFTFNSDIIDYVPEFQRRGVWIALSIYFLGILVRFDKLLMKGLLLFCIFDTVGFMFLYFTFRGVYFSYDSGTGDFLVFAYRLLPCVLFFAICFSLTHSVKYLIIFLISFLFLSGMGNRGSVLLTLLFIVFLEFTTMKSIKRFIGVLVCATFVFAGMNFFLDKAVETLNSYDMSVRFIERLGMNTLFEDRIRVGLSDLSYDYIRSNPWGYGFLSDRKLLGNYPHRIYLELWLQFGLYVGSIIILTISFILFKSLRRLKKFYPQELFYLYCLILFVVMRLFLSMSYTFDGFFFLLLGISNNIIRNNRIDNIDLSDSIKVSSSEQPFYDGSQKKPETEDRIVAKRQFLTNFSVLSSRQKRLGDNVQLQRRRFYDGRNVFNKLVRLRTIADAMFLRRRNTFNKLMKSHTITKAEFIRRRNAFNRFTNNKRGD